MAPKHEGAAHAWACPTRDDEIAKAGDAVKGQTEMDALIAYLQVLGTARQVRSARHGHQ